MSLNIIDLWIELVHWEQWSRVEHRFLCNFSEIFNEMEGSIEPEEEKHYWGTISKTLVSAQAVNEDGEDSGAEDGEEDKNSVESS